MKILYAILIHHVVWFFTLVLLIPSGILIMMLSVPIAGITTLIGIVFMLFTDISLLEFLYSLAQQSENKTGLDQGKFNIGLGVFYLTILFSAYIVLTIFVSFIAFWSPPVFWFMDTIKKKSSEEIRKKINSAAESIGKGRFSFVVRRDGPPSVGVVKTMGKTIIALSDNMNCFFSSEELKALVAHEHGHLTLEKKNSLYKRLRSNYFFHHFLSTNLNSKKALSWRMFFIAVPSILGFKEQFQRGIEMTKLFADFLYEKIYGLFVIFFMSDYHSAEFEADRYACEVTSAAVLSQTIVKMVGLSVFWGNDCSSFDEFKKVFNERMTERSLTHPAPTQRLIEIGDWSFPMSEREIKKVYRKCKILVGSYAQTETIKDFAVPHTPYFDFISVPPSNQTIEMS